MIRGNERERESEYHVTLELIFSRKIEGVPSIKCFKIRCSKIRCVSIRCPKIRCFSIRRSRIKDSGLISLGQL